MDQQAMRIGWIPEHWRHAVRRDCAQHSVCTHANVCGAVLGRLRDHTTVTYRRQIAGTVFGCCNVQARTGTHARFRRCLGSCRSSKRGSRGHSGAVTHGLPDSVRMVTGV